MSSRPQATDGPRCNPALLATLVVAALVAMLPLPAQGASVPYLVKNINAATEGSYAQEHTAVGGNLFFVAIQPPAGIGLWKTDGTRELWAVPSSCGDGARDLGEECDDGNAAAGDGCDASCRDETLVAPTPLPTPTPTPGPATECPTAPVAGCVPSADRQTMLAIHDGKRAGHDTLQWKWRKGAVTSTADFGDPTSGDGVAYRLCIYDGDSQLTFDAAIPAGGSCGRARSKPCWKRTAKGYQYDDPERTPDGIEHVRLERGTRPGKSSIEVKGRGPLLDDPTFPLVQPVTVQLRRANAPVCWESVHTGPRTGR